ncbi:MAG: DUF1549 domain-containing protein [Gemmataceae bacterium]
MGRRDFLLIALVAAGLFALGANLFTPLKWAPKDQGGEAYYRGGDFQQTVESLDRFALAQWENQHVAPASRAADLQIARRLSLALTGTSPSLEEVRKFESLPNEERLSWWVDHLLRDRRYADFIAERWARAVVGTEDGPFLLYRRRRFVTWLADEFAKNVPYDIIVRELIASSGIWTDHPATNFITVTSRPDEKNQPDPVRLAGRATRAFLGIRLDCAQCHDHPFASWTQEQFEGFSAFFGQTQMGLTGIHDGAGDYRVEDRKTRELRTVAPSVPFGNELLPAEGSRRSQLAAWITHPKNPYFARATVNRVWAILFGKPLVAPIDNLEPNGPSGDKIPAFNQTILNLLATDFVSHQYDMQRLIRIIVSTRMFQLDSRIDRPVSETDEKLWAVFPLTRLRPEQVVGALVQSASPSTIDASSHLFTRLIRFGQQNDFIKQYGDSGDDEFDERSGTIPQRLVMMNGNLVHERTKPSPFNASTRIAMMASTDAKAIEVAYLSVLSRRPTTAEMDHFLAGFGEGTLTRAERLEDLYWTLLNSTEFSWNH